MTEEQKDQLRQKWKSWLDEIGDELGWLLTGRDFFWRLQKIVQSNKKIQSPAILHKWIADSYVAKVATGIRKIVGKNESMSLYKLIEGIKNNPDVITREYFISQWHDKVTKELGIDHQTFDKYTEPGGQHVNLEGLARDLQMLDEDTQLIKTFTDKWVAHLDKNRETIEMPTFGDLDTALDVVDKVWCKYKELLTCSAPETQKPAIPEDWEAPLLHPWIVE